ncbi:MAG: hypothetical protein GY859_29015 [Desulfobacterales bacterium]|nr:hypothetical protein [Desulfobacterales bacterium]
MHLALHVLVDEERIVVSDENELLLQGLLAEFKEEVFRAIRRGAPRVDDPVSKSAASYECGNPTPAEQAHLDAVNRARANPLAEAARLDIDLFEGVAPGAIDRPRPPPPSRGPPRRGDGLPRQWKRRPITISATTRWTGAWCAGVHPRPIFESDAGPFQL